ncbi:cellulose biosynthesis cyclic di-GMP-binding regulatory protein BcsB [Paraburkholderia phenazinium]|uniref:Cyclic di-GMP-binding protein n=1 Tax=Paraburkholderia phenazinium TaxID=60549 RepID=A0A1G8ITX1_9BURK|nr:cellulose biosynthesis cyclic di-GMP-binding regulatory protein BcsB [Paraburkholderia phenazinium]SDI22371.1 cellulose synthase subunit [Paraburkholderia phenazinium]
MSTSSTSRAIVRAVYCALALLVPGAAFAAAHPTNQTVAGPADAQVVAAKAAPVSLATLANLSGVLRLAGAAASSSMSVPVSAREQVLAATLHLVVTNSISLLTDRSQLAVRINGRTVAQLQLSSRQPEATADIRIPADLLRPGYNTLTFAVAQHTTENCEDPDSPELWTEIDTSASTLQLQTELKPLTPTLADLDELIDPKQWSARPLDIVNAAHPDSDPQLASGGLLAQGIALRLRYLDPALRVLDAQRGAGEGMLPGFTLASLAGADVLLIGTRDALRGELDPQIAERIQSGFLGIYPKPGDARHFVLVVSGRDDSEVNRAARAFAHRELRLPHRDEMLIRELDESAMPAWSANRTVSGTAPHTFRQLGLTSRTLGPGEHADMEIRLPADIYAPEDARVNLDMNFTEGAKMREDSVLNIFLNGRFEQVIALDQQQGAVMRRYRVTIPLRDFKPGANTLSLRPVLVPLVTDRCALRSAGNLVLTVFDDSTLTLPPASHFTTLPDLKRLADSGFPYTVQPDGAVLAVRVASHDNDTIAAAWTLLARLAQTQMAPLTDAQVTYGEPAPGRDTILIGAAAALPPPELQDAPWSPGHAIRIADGGLAPEQPGGNWFVQHWDSWFGTPADTAPASVTLRGDARLSDRLLVMQYRGKGAGKLSGTVTVLTSRTTPELLLGVTRLVASEYWTDLDGDVALLSFEHAGLWTSRVGDTYETGTLRTWDHLGFVLSQHPWFGYAVLILLLAVFATSTALLLQRHHRNRHRDADQ